MLFLNIVQVTSLHLKELSNFFVGNCAQSLETSWKEDCAKRSLTDAYYHRTSRVDDSNYMWNWHLPENSTYDAQHL